MDRSKPFRRLLPVGILSAAGFAGCASTPAYRPLITSQAPSRPLAAAEAPANSSSAPVAPSLGAPIEPAPGPPPMDPPPRPGTYESSAQSLNEPSQSPPSQTTPSQAAQSQSPPSQSTGPAFDAPGPGVVQPHLSTPMGVLQTPLMPPPAPAASSPDDGQPLRAPQVPTDASLSAPGQASVSVNLDAEHGIPLAANGAAGTNTEAQKPPGKKSKPAKPADPPLSPLARLRKRFHSFTHPAPKQTVPEGDSKPVAATQVTIARPASGYRIPLPTPEVAAKVATPPIHGLYASDDVDAAHAVVSDAKNGPAEPTSQQPQENLPVQIAPSEATKPVASTEIEQWPFSAPGATTAQASPAAADASNDFTAISDDEYRTGRAQIDHANGPTIVASPNSPPPAPPAEQVPPNDSLRPHASFVPAPAPAPAAASEVLTPPVASPAVSANAAPPAPPESQKSVMVVVPQAVPSALPESSARPLQSIRGQASHESAAVGYGLSLRDLALGVPASQRPTIEPIGASDRIDENGNPAGSFNPGWTLPPIPIEATRSVRSVPVAAPRSVVYPQTPSSRYGQPGVNARPSPSAPVVQAVTQPAPSAVSPPTTR